MSHDKDNSNVMGSTLAYNYCIGCGVCSSVCPTNAISMNYTEKKEYNPVVDNSLCISCKECVKYCPHTINKVNSEAKKICGSKDPNSYGIENSQLLLGYDSNEGDRKKSASGGITSKLAIHMLNNGIVDAVIHAEMIEGKIGEPHYKASISFSEKEVNDKRSSYYGPITFDEVLSEFKGKHNSILLIGVPCVIRAFTGLFKNNPKYNKNKIYTIALSCSHNVSGMFVDYLAESLKINKEQKFKVNLRNKDNIKDANNYNNHFFDKSQDLSKINRYQSIFTETWRSYFFAINVCNYCSDFWGYTADISVKDAWGEKWAQDPLGKSILVVRSKEIVQMLDDIKSLVLEKLDFDKIKNCQKDTTKYKQVETINKINKSKVTFRNIRNGLFAKNLILNKSKILYMKYGYEKSYKKMKKYIVISKFLGKYSRLHDKLFNFK
mgnify:FL=1